jgi:hypothetical protein
MRLGAKRPAIQEPRGAADGTAVATKPATLPQGWGGKVYTQKLLTNSHAIMACHERMQRFRTMETPQKFGSVLSRPSHRGGFRGFLGFGLVCLSAFSATRSDAAVIVEGDRDQVQISVDHDTVGQVLHALGQKGKLQYRSAAPLRKVIRGRFSGSLGQVLSRILAGFDFVVHYDPEGVEIFVYGESGATAIPLQKGASPGLQAASARPASQVAEQTSVGAGLVPKNVAPVAPSQYDVPGASRLPTSH